MILKKLLMLQKIILILFKILKVSKLTFLLYLIFGFFPILLSAQDTITGIVCNHDTKEQIAYVSIGVLEKDFGTVSNRHGRFYLKKSENILSTDSVIFSNIGFKVKSIQLPTLIIATPFFLYLLLMNCLK